MEHEHMIKLSRGAVAQIRREAKRTAKSLPSVIIMPEDAKMLLSIDRKSAASIINEFFSYAMGRDSSEKLSEEESSILNELISVQDFYFDCWEKECAKANPELYRQIFKKDTCARNKIGGVK